MSSLRELLDRHGNDIRDAFRKGDARTLIALERALGAWQPRAEDLETLRNLEPEARASIIVSCALSEAPAGELDNVLALTRSLAERGE